MIFSFRKYDISEKKKIKFYEDFWYFADVTNNLPIFVEEYIFSENSFFLVWVPEYFLKQTVAWKCGYLFFYTIWVQTIVNWKGSINCFWGKESWWGPLLHRGGLRKGNDELIKVFPQETIVTKTKVSKIIYFNIFLDQ